MSYLAPESREELDRRFSETVDLLLGRKTYEILAGFWR
jgi:dihydrofolate reductase